MATREALLRLETDCIAELQDKLEPWDYTTVIDMIHAKLNDPFGPTKREIEDTLALAHDFSLESCLAAVCARLESDAGDVA